MNRFGTLIVVMAASFLAASTRTSSAIEPTLMDRWSARFARITPWHGNYYHTAWGQPVAVLVPPNAHMQSRWGWGVCQNTIHPIHHRMVRPYPGYTQDEVMAAGAFRGTPNWVSHTDQYGVYYVRSPWE
jgi:hypothetical protein